MGTNSETVDVVLNRPDRPPFSLPPTATVSKLPIPAYSLMSNASHLIALPHEVPSWPT